MISALRIMSILMGAICLAPSISFAEWILIESREDGKGASVTELDDRIEENGSSRVFNVRSSYRSKVGGKEAGEFLMEYSADCAIGVIRNTRAVAYMNGRRMEGPPASEPIVMPSKPFEKIYPYVCR